MTFVWISKTWQRGFWFLVFRIFKSEWMSVWSNKETRGKHYMCCCSRISLVCCTPNGIIESSGHLCSWYDALNGFGAPRILEHQCECFSLSYCSCHGSRSFWSSMCEESNMKEFSGYKTFNGIVHYCHFKAKGRSKFLGLRHASLRITDVQDLSQLIWILMNLCMPVCVCDTQILFFCVG